MVGGHHKMRNCAEGSWHLESREPLSWKERPTPVPNPQACINPFVVLQEDATH